MSHHWLTDYLPSFRRLLSLVDAIIVCFSAFTAYVAIVYFREGNFVLDWPEHYRTAVILGSFITLVLFYDLGLYRGWRGETLDHELRRVGLAWTLVFMAMVLLAVATKTSGNFSRLWGVSWYALTLGLLWLERITARSVLHLARSQGMDQKTIVLLGGQQAADRVARILADNAWAGYQVRGYFANSPEKTLPHLKNLRHLGGIAAVRRYVNRMGGRLNEVWIALSSDEQEHFRDVIDHMSSLPVDTRYVPDLFDMKLMNSSVSHVASMPIVNMNHSPLMGFNRQLKNTMDKMMAALAIILLSPLLAAIALAIKLSSPGPVIFKQRRHGWRNEIFYVYKFRTLHHRDLSKEKFSLVSRDDPRIYPLGRFLRKTSLDELPQLFNVLQGRMSLVGPRPQPIEFNQQYHDIIDYFAWRHKVRPGITGWAQVNGLRGDIDAVEELEQRIQYDLYYIEHWSIWLDIKIILLTVVRGFWHEKAY